MFLTMSTNQVSQLAGMVANNMTNSIIGVACEILMVIGFWILFESKKESGWKAIIPIYSTYIAYKLFFKKSKFWALFIFWIVLILSFIMVLVVGIVSLGGSLPGAIGVSGIISCILIFISSIAIVVISIQFDIAICKRYNMGLLFTLGMIFAMPLFIGILAYEVRAGKVSEQL